MNIGYNWFVGDYNKFLWLPSIDWSSDVSTGDFIKLLPYSWSLFFALFYIDVFHVDGILLAVRWYEPKPFEILASICTQHPHMSFAFGLNGESQTYHGYIINSLSLYKILYVFVSFLHFDLICLDIFSYILFIIMLTFCAWYLTCTHPLPPLLFITFVVLHC